MENTQKKSGGQTFLKGALVLGIANLIVKIIGAVFKIPLATLIGNDGGGYFNVAYQIYTFMFIIATAGFPIAISKMVAESMAKNDERDARRVFQTAFTFLTIIGFIGASVLFLFNEQLAALVGIPDAALGIKIISPAVFFVSMACAFRGFFQGRQNMVPTACSEIIEASGKMVIGLLAAGFIMGLPVNAGLKTAVDWIGRQVSSLHAQTVYASGGAILGVTTGTLLSFLLLTVIYFFTKKRRSPLVAVQETLRSRKTILKELIMIAIPITIGASVSSLTTLIDMATISRRLVIRPQVFDAYASMFSEGTKFYENMIRNGWTGLELYQQKAASLYGLYTMKAMTMFNLPLTLIVGLGMSVVPAISAALAKKKPIEARNITESTIRIATLFAAPCALGMSVLSKQVLHLLFSETDASRVLSILSIAIFCVSIVSVSNAILQSYGKVYYPVINMVIGGLVKVLFNFFCIPYLGIEGAPIGTTLCYLIIAVLNMVSIIRISGMRFKWLDFIIKPILAALIMGAAAFVMDTFLPIHKLLTIVELGICVIVYFFAIFAVRAIKKEDILNLPKGDKIAEILTRYKLLK